MKAPDLQCEGVVLSRPVKGRLRGFQPAAWVVMVVVAEMAQ